MYPRGSSGSGPCAQPARGHPRPGWSAGRSRQRTRLRLLRPTGWSPRRRSPPRVRRAPLVEQQNAMLSWVSPFVSVVLVAGGVARRQECVVKDEAGHVVAECDPGGVVEPCVLAGVDAAETGLFCGGAETVEGAGHAGQRRRAERKVLLVAVEAGEHVSSGGADGAVCAGVGGVGGGVAG